MPQKRAPYILLFVLVLVLVLFGGIRYGQRVEKANKVIDYIQKYVPTAPPTPTVASLEFTKFSHDNCGLSFLVPKNFVTKKASDSAQIQENEELIITFSCEQKIQNQKITKGKELAFQDGKIIAEVKEDSEPMHRFILMNPQNRKTLEITIAQRLYALFEQTVQFTGSK